MTGWWAALGPLAVWAALAGIGAVAALLGGFRGPVVPAAALPAGVFAVTGVGLLEEAVRVPFGWLTTAALAWTVGAAIGLGRWLHSRPRRTSPGDEACLARTVGRRREPSWPVAAALAVSTATAYLVLWSAAGGDWSVASQTWDAFFDANAVRAAFDSRIIAPTEVSAFAFAYPVDNYYPSTFHGLGVLVMQATGADAVTATNVAAALVAGGLWPATVALAARYLLGGGQTILLTSVVVAWGFHGMPWSPLGWGVLWATALAGAAVPLAVATFAGVLGVTHVPRHRRLAGLLFGTSTVLVAALHPRIAVLTATVLLVPWIWVLGGRAWRRWRAGRRRAGLGLAVMALAPVGLLVVVSLGVGRGAGELVARAWPIRQGRLAEVLQYAVGGPDQSLPRVLVSVLILVGAVVAWRHPARRWLVVLFVAAMALDVVTATTNYVRPFNAVARFWYNDRHRSIVIPPASAALLAVLGWEWIRAAITRRRGAVRLVPALAALVLAWGAVGAVQYLRPSYAEAAADPAASFVSPHEVAFYERVARVVPAGQRVLNNPWDGSGLLYAYTGVPTVYYVLGGTPSTANGMVLRDRLVTMTTDEACAALRADGVRWILDGGTVSNALPSLPPQVAPGMQIPAGFWATTLVLQDGDLRLYEVTGCGTGTATG